jgi:SNF2 family DNA or RNA helicase
VPLTQEQKLIYQSIILKYKQSNNLEILSSLLMVTSHPFTYNENYSDSYETSGKMIALAELVEKIRDNKKKCLIFVRYLKTIDIIQQLVKGRKVKILTIEGSMSGEQRKEICDEFTRIESPAILALTYQSSSLGLNLQSADIVIHYDRWWNPAVEKQAEDRAHRMGRKGDVNVYYLHCVGSIDEKIELLQQEKQQLIENLIRTNKPNPIIELLISELAPSYDTGEN